MAKAQWDRAFDKFIRHGEEHITPKTFFELLREIEQERTAHTIELRAKVVKGRLQFEPSSEISVRDNEIVIGRQRIVVRVCPETAPC